MAAIPSSADMSLLSSDKFQFQLWSGLLSLLVFLVLVFLVRSKCLKASYSLLWFAAWFGCSVLIVKPEWMDLLGRLSGVHYSPALLLLLMVFANALIVLHVTVVLTRLTRQMNRCAQEISLIKEKIEGPGECVV
jgi:hypothetical protein